jgi:hypothetical protein
MSSLGGPTPQDG